jgi:hypothetical protein
MVLKECEDLATVVDCLDDETVKDGLRRLDLFEGDRQRVQARLNDADDIIRMRKAQSCLNEILAPEKRMEMR